MFDTAMMYILSMSGPMFLGICVVCVVVGSVALGYSLAEYRRHNRRGREYLRFVDKYGPADFNQVKR